MAQLRSKLLSRGRLERAAVGHHAIPRVQGVHVHSAVGKGRSRPLIIEADDGRNYVVKLRASPKTARRLIAEVIAWQLAAVAGIPQPDIALIEIEDTIVTLADLEEDKLTELRDSPGWIFGSEEIPGVSTLRRGINPPMTSEEAARIVWFDSLVMNADRKWRNPNILTTKQGEYWVIDNDSAFHLHHRWAEPGKRAPYRLSPVDGTTWWTKVDHVLLPWASSIADAGDDLAKVIDERVIDAAVTAVPPPWFDQAFPDGSTMEPADAYREFLRNRLVLRRDFESLADYYRSHGVCAERA